MNHRILFLLLSLCFVSLHCKKQQDIDLKPDPEFKKYISGYTSGLISRNSPLTLRLTSAVPTVDSTTKSRLDHLWNIKPSIEGKTVWLDDRTVQFVPEEYWDVNQSYVILFALSKLIDLDAHLSSFPLSVHTGEPSLAATVEGMESIEGSALMKFSGKINTSDIIEDEVVENLVQLKIDGNIQTVSWQHNSNNLEHHFVIDSIQRLERAQTVTVEYNNSYFGDKPKKTIRYELPSVNEFKLMNIAVKQIPEQMITLLFSDLIDANQSFTGLFSIDNYEDFRVSVKKNRILLYPKKKFIGTYNLKVFKSLENTNNKTLNKDLIVEIKFDEHKPQISFPHTGNILPDGNGLIFPFRAVNVNAVDLKVIKIYEDNIPQFLQNNELSGDYNIAQVGKRIVNKKIDLNLSNETQSAEWNNYYLDLSEWMETEPGAIYRIMLDIKPEYSTYPCDGEEPMPSLSNDSSSELDGGTDDYYATDWDYYSYNNYSYRYYDWEERDNPCHVSYYMYDRGISTNILASNLAILAKSGKDRKLFVTVNEIGDASAVNKADVKVYDYQNQLIAEDKTDKMGNLVLELSAKPFLIVASKGNQHSYLKVADGNALSTSHFDVSGQHSQDGMKSFIYTDRGVWRPGDTIHLCMILQDGHHLVPESYPVKVELIDPRNQVHSSRIYDSNVNNTYYFKIPTAESFLAGQWKARIKLGSAVWHKNLRIETIKPNRLKIDFKLSSNEIKYNDNASKAIVDVNWLHGATAKNLKLRTTGKFSNAATVFKGYEDYTFVDYSKSYTGEERVLIEGQLDDAGHLESSFNFNSSLATPGKLKVDLNTRVFESGGEFSVHNRSATYSPYPRYVGIKTDVPGSSYSYSTDTLNYFDIVSLDQDGKPVDLQNLQVEIYKTEWRWWWDASTESYGSYSGNNYDQYVIKKNVSTKNGKCRVDFRIDYPDWGRYIIRVVDNVGKHSASKSIYLDWPEWRDRSEIQNPDGAQILVFSTDKKKYKVGEIAKVSVPKVAKGRALMTVENGTEILHSQWIDVADKDWITDFKISPAMSPNAYVNITLIQEHKHDNSLPIRLYGITPIEVNDQETVLNPQINMSNELAPESVAELKISESNGKPMSYTIALVDDGLLDLTNFKTPDPHSAFYAREALGVRTWDVYDYIIGAYGGELERVLSIGGDEEAIEKGSSQVNRFKPVVRFMGPFYLDKNKSKVHKVEIPNYIGSIRVMVVANHERSYGSSEFTAYVRKPLMVLATLPRVLGPGERVSLPVTVFAMDDKIRNVELTLETSENIRPVGNRKSSVAFSETGDKTVNFELQVNDNVGVGKVVIKAVSGSISASYPVELNIRNPILPVSRSTQLIVPPDSTVHFNYQNFGMPGTNALSLEVTNILPINLRNRMKSLLQYPHGCAEQLTSKAFPQLYIADLLGEEDVWSKRVNVNVNQALTQLARYQNSDGGFSIWPNGGQADDWVSSYVGHFILEAEKKGFFIPFNMKDKWIRFQQTVARSYNRADLQKGDTWSSNRDFAQAYRLFTLAMAGEAEVGSMNRLKADNALDAAGLWRLASCYYLIGQEQAANEVLGFRKLEIQQHDYHYYRYNYGSATRDKAMVLECMSIMNKKAEAFELAKEISESLSDQSWMSTQTTAFSLLAMFQFTKGQTLTNDMTFTYGMNRGDMNNIHTVLPLRQMDLPVVNDQSSGQIIIRNDGKNNIYARLIESGIPQYGNELEESNNLKVEIRYLDMNGNNISVDKIDQGTDFTARVQITNPDGIHEIDDLALTQIFPSGWEILESSEASKNNQYSQSGHIYKEVRDDRVMTYFELDRYRNASRNNYTKVFDVRLNAAYLGRYYLPGIKAESMYNNKISANTKGQWVEVVLPGATD